MEFTEDEVREKLKELGYQDVPRSKLLEFMADLEELIQLDLSGCASSINDGDSSKVEDTTREDIPLQDVTTKFQAKAFAKEKIKPPMHHISFDKENLPLFDREDIPVFDSTGCNETLSSTILSTDANVSSVKEVYIRPNSGMKRKVVRKRNGSSRIFDESTMNEESVLSDITALEERVRNLPIIEDDRASINSSGTRYKQHRSKSLSSINSSNANPPSSASLPSFIRQSVTHPHTKNLMKCDPVSRFHQFNKEWKHNKFPGESSHSNVRWNVRERMLHCEVFEKPRHQHVANDYVVPTEKKRQSLRWKVRTAMANM